jgi:hypothetical protein
MRRPNAPVLLLITATAAILMAACGGAGDNTSTTCDYSQAPITPPPRETLIAGYTLEEARAQVDHELYTPRELPPGVVLTGVTVSRSSFCPDRVLMTQLHYRGPSTGFDVTEGRGTGRLNGTPVRIGSSDGTMRRFTDTRNLLVVEFKRGDVYIGLSAPITGTQTEEVLLEVLRSIPE